MVTRTPGPFSYFGDLHSGVTGDTIRASTNEPALHAADLSALVAELEADQRRIGNEVTGSITRVAQAPTVPKATASRLAANAYLSIGLLRRFGNDVDVFDTEVNSITLAYQEQLRDAGAIGRADPDFRPSVISALMNSRWRPAEQALEDAASAVARDFDTKNPGVIVDLIRDGLIPLSAAALFPDVQLSAADRRQAMTILTNLLQNPPMDYLQLQLLLGEARGLGLAPQTYAPTLQAYWRYRAAEAAGIDLSAWDPSKGAGANRVIIEQVYRYYGDLFLANPDLQWAGMANMIGPSFAAGFFDLDMFRDFAQKMADVPPELRPFLPPGLGKVAEMSDQELAFYERTFLSMQQQIFFDQGSMHQAYVDGGLVAIEEMRAAGLIDDRTAQGWIDVDSGDPARVADGNTHFLYREQHDIIDRQYQEMRNHPLTGDAMTWIMTQIGEPSIPGARGYADFDPLHIDFETPGPERITTPESIFGHKIPHLDVDNPTQVYVDVKTPFANGNIADFDDRWALIEQDTLPAYQRLLAEDPEHAEELIRADVADRIGDYRLQERVDDILHQLEDWDVDVDQ